MCQTDAPKISQAAGNRVNAIIEAEQGRLDAFHQDLARQIAHLEQRIAHVSSAPSTGTGQDDLEREAHLLNLHQQLRAARAAERRLCFGRIDTEGEPLYIGRVGLRSQQGDVLLVDWRAPQAAPFYQATSAQPLGLEMRRRISSRSSDGRDVITHVDDEYFSDSFDGASHAAAGAMDAPRDGRMADILSTIAADQDAIIRSPLEQVTVVQGGPGTGKTVVALHRAAWLLYTYREKLARDGVLIVGPSTMFLRYIDQVLPSLGETDVVLTTPATLVPGIRATETDSPEVAAVKGDARMAEVIARAISARIRLPQSNIRIETEGSGVVSLSQRQIADAAKGLSRTHRYHEGRDVFLRRLLEIAARTRLRAAGDSQPDAQDIADEIGEFIDDKHVRRELNLMWMPTNAEDIIRRLLTDAPFLAKHADGILSRREQMLLMNSTHDGWAPDDIPLIDEAVFRLGVWVRPRAKSAAIDPDDPRELSASDLHIANRYAEERSHRTLAERSADDHEWIYGHVIVDEAQELSAMAWRAIERRSSRRSMTVVGDLQQASHPAAARSWRQALGWSGDKLHVHELTITYRITEEIAATAMEWLVRFGGDAPSIRPIRSGPPTQSLILEREQLKDIILSTLGDFSGRAAVIVAEAEYGLWSELLVGPEFASGANAIDAMIGVLTAQDSKGLEFDHVFVINPEKVANERPNGSSIYVACTRATTQLHLLTTVSTARSDS